jgi:hypothetical protein
MHIPTSEIHQCNPGDNFTDLYFFILRGNAKAEKHDLRDFRSNEEYYLMKGTVLMDCVL